MRVKATMVLCGAATVRDGMLDITGGGWQVTGPDSFKHAVALLLQVPRDRGGTVLRVRLELQDAEGAVVPMPTPWSASKAELSIDLEVERPRAGRLPIISVPLVADVPRMTLKPSSRYAWRLFVDGQTRPGWQLPFATLDG